MALDRKNAKLLIEHLIRQDAKFSVSPVETIKTPGSASSSREIAKKFTISIIKINVTKLQDFLDSDEGSVIRLVTYDIGGGWGFFD